MINVEKFFCIFCFKLMMFYHYLSNVYDDSLNKPVFNRIIADFRVKVHMCGIALWWCFNPQFVGKVYHHKCHSNHIWRSLNLRVYILHDSSLSKPRQILCGKWFQALQTWIIALGLHFSSLLTYSFLGKQKWTILGYA